MYRLLMISRHLWSFCGENNVRFLAVKYTAWKVSVFGVVLVRIFSIRTDYGDLLSKSPYWVRMMQNSDQKTPNTNTFTRCETFWLGWDWGRLDVLQEKIKWILNLKKFKQTSENFLVRNLRHLTLLSLVSTKRSNTR